jgi:MoxR-like ATPase
LAKEDKVADVFHTRRIRALIAQVDITSVISARQLSLVARVAGHGTLARVALNLIDHSRANTVSVSHWDAIRL